MTNNAEKPQLTIPRVMPRFSSVLSLFLIFIYKEKRQMELRKFIATTIREYLSENYDIKKKYFNNEIELISDFDDDVYVIIARHIVDGEIARATFSYSKKIGGWYGNDVNVSKKYRRIGLMTNIYNFAEELIGQKLIPSLSLSNNMKKFWDKRNG